MFANTTNNSKSNVLASRSQGYLWYRQSTTVSTGQPIGEAIPTDAYAFWETKWFQDALYSEHGLTTWGLAFGQSKELLFLSLASVKDSSNANPFGVVALGVPMSSLTNIIMRFDLQGVDMYLATEDGYLLAQTGSIFHVEGDLDKPILLEATKSSNLVVAGAALYLKSKLENISRLGNETFRTTDARIQGAEYIVDSAPLHLAGKSLVFVLIIPHKSIWGSMTSQSQTTLFHLIMLAGCMFLVSFLFIFSLIRATTKEMHLCAGLIRQIEATKRSERKSNHKSIVFANMSHDLRTSLAAIIGLIDLCHYDAAKGSELEGNLFQMNTCASDLLGILNSILDISKIEAGKLQLEETDFNIVHVLEEVVDMFSVVALKKDIEVVLDLCDESVQKVSWVKGDVGRLKQILSNLLSNGVKFTTEGHVVLRSWVKQVAPRNPFVDKSQRGQILMGLWNHMFKWFLKDGEAYKQIDTFSKFQADPNYVEFEFEVDDTGKGIPKDRRKAVFEEFVQVDKLTTKKHDGTGLGLGIVKSLVHLMGGDISIIDKEEPGEQGTCFRFNLFFKRTSKKYTIAKSTNEINQLSGIHPPDGASLQDTLGSSGRSAIQDWQQGVKSKSFTSGISEADFCKSPPLVEGVHAILAMHGEAGKSVLKKWLEQRGVQVWMLSQWEDLVPTLENLRHEFFFNSFRSSSTFESVSREYHFSDTVGCDLTDEVVKQIEMNRVSTYLLILLDINMIVGPMEQVLMLLNKFSGSGQIPNYKVVWLATANTSSMDLEKLKSGMVPCDLILHKPIHGSRLYAIWELVQDLTRKIMLQPSEVKAPSVLQQLRTSDEPCRTTMVLDNRQDQIRPQLVSTQNNKKLRPLSSLAGMHILVAEDNVVLQRLAKSMLVRLGATVECVYNGAEAVRLVSEALHNNMKANKDISSSGEMSLEASAPANLCGFDILLMDCEMPEMDGYEATRRIRDEERCYGCRLPIIALTAHAMVEEEIKCFQAGMDFHLSKPLVMESLLNVITKILSK